jgi:Uncharacterized protein conserved in bacteria (DUF2263)
MITHGAEKIIKTASTPGATTTSTFISSQLLALDPTRCPHHPRSKISVMNTDMFAAARSILQMAGDGVRGRTTVLNLASDEERGGGGAYTLSKT